MSRILSGFWAAALLGPFEVHAKPPEPLTAAKGPAIGRVPTKAEIRKLDLTVLPSGEGLAAGSGTPREGNKAYAVHCAACHGPEGEGLPGYAPLVGGRGTVGGPNSKLTVGSYWPYATTLWDYVRRAMPYQSPGSLTNDEVYAITAWILYANDIIDEDARVDRRSLPRIEMPNRGGFVRDPRPDVRGRAE